MTAKKKKKKKIEGILAPHFPNLMEKLSIHLMNSKLMNSKLNIFKVIYTYLLQSNCSMLKTVRKF